VRVQRLLRRSVLCTLARRALDEDEVLAEWSASDRDSYEAAAEVFRREIDAG